MSVARRASAICTSYIFSALLVAIPQGFELHGVVLQMRLQALEFELDSVGAAPPPPSPYFF